MINFMNSIGQKDRDYYTKIAQIIGFKDINKQKGKSRIMELNNEEMFDFCRFNDRKQHSILFQNNISRYQQQGTGNTCLHIAGEYGNIQLVKFILKNNLVNTASINNNKDNPLFHTLKHSEHENFQKSVLLLSQHSDLTQKDKEDKYAYEVDLSTFTKARVRVLEAIRQQFYAKLRQK